VGTKNHKEMRGPYIDSKADFLAFHYDRVEEAASISDDLFVWTVDSPVAIRALLQHPCVAAIITNQVAVALDCRESAN
jgi:hypothetical protein